MRWIGTLQRLFANARSRSILAGATFGLAAAAAALPAAAQDRPALAEAEEVVRALYAAHARFAADGRALLNDADASRPYFADNLMRDGLQGALMFDPIYNAQAHDVSNLSIGLHPERPALRGTAFVVARFDNFGAPQKLTYLLRVLPGTDAFQIINIETDEWIFTDLLAELGAETVPMAERVTLSDARETSGAGAEPVRRLGDSGNASANQILVFDASGSMWQKVDGEYKISIARRVVGDLLNRLPPDRSIGLVAYGHRTKGECGDIETLVRPGDGSRDSVRAAVAGLSPKGKTPLTDAVVEAARQLRFSEEPATVILVSDGKETCGQDPCSAAVALEKAGVDFTAHAIGFDLQDAAGIADLQCLAGNTGGRYFSADNAEELSAALTEVAIAAPEPEPVDIEPEELPLAPSSSVVFEDTFDGSTLAPHWTVENDMPALRTVADSEAWFASVQNRMGSPRQEGAHNRLLLDEPLPDGDFDLVVDFSMLWQSGHEGLSISLFDDADNQYVAWFWNEWKGCGMNPGLSILRRAAGDGDVEETQFQTKLFSGPYADDICTVGREYADAVMSALTENGATLSLSRRGRRLFASIEMELPANDDRPAEVKRVTTQDLTALRFPQRVAIVAGHWGQVERRESVVRIDRFAIEIPE